MDPVVILDIRTNERKILDPNGDGKGYVGSASFSPSGKILLFGNTKGIVFVIETENYQVCLSQYILLLFPEFIFSILK